MSPADSPVVTITVPADIRYFRSVRLAVGGLATVVGFDIEAIDDLRIGVDEICATLAEAGSGEELRIEVTAEPGQRIRIEGSTDRGELGVDPDRFMFSRQILSVVADEFGYDLDGSAARFWLERRLALEPADAGGS